MEFRQYDRKLEVASTRPELLPACVAILVHPDDPRFKPIVGKKVTVRLFNQVGPILEDPDVDCSFGTGAVMVCTFGDKMDVKWQNKYKPPLIRAITENGRLVVEDPRIKGLRTEEARKRIAELFTGQGKITKTEPQTQSVGVCWRCKTPLEIISRPQWFMKTRDMTEDVVEKATKLR